MISFAELVSGKQSRVAPHGQTPPAGPGGRQSRSRVSGASDSARSGKIDRTGNVSSPARFAAFARACDASERDTAKVADVGFIVHAQRTFDHIPSAHGLRQSAVRQALAHGSRTEREIAAEEREAARVGAAAVALAQRAGVIR